MAGVRRGAFTCVGWQVTLCDPMWQVTFLRWDSHEELCRPLPLHFMKLADYIFMHLIIECLIERCVTAGLDIFASDVVRHGD